MSLTRQGLARDGKTIFWVGKVVDVIDAVIFMENFEDVEEVALIFEVCVECCAETVGFDDVRFE